MNRLAAMGLSLVLGLGACAKKPDRNEAAGSAAVEIMPRAEQLRGEEACAAYLAQVCACSDALPALQLTEECTFAKGYPQALALSLDLGMHPETSAKTVTDLQRSARKIIANCVTSTAALAMKGCPQQGL